jgi:hypothetical protein
MALLLFNNLMLEVEQVNLANLRCQPHCLQMPIS